MTITVGFQPITETNTNCTNQQVPVGATEWRVKLTGGGAAGTNGASNTGTGNAVGGRGGAGGGGLKVSDWQPIGLLGPTYSVHRGLGATTAGGNGEASTFPSGSISLSAGGGTGQTGGTCSATGLPVAPSMNSGGNGGGWGFHRNNGRGGRGW